MTPARPVRLKCPCCEQQTRRANQALCPRCWGVAPRRAKLRHAAVYRGYVAGTTSITELLASIARVADASRIEQYGFTP